MDYRERINQIVKKAANDGQNSAMNLSRAGIFEPLYLYYLPATEKQDGALVLVPDSSKAPEGYKLATGEGLRGNVPYASYSQWIRDRSGSLPLLASY